MPCAEGVPGEVLAENGSLVSSWQRTGPWSLPMPCARTQKFDSSLGSFQQHKIKSSLSSEQLTTSFSSLEKKI